MKKARVTLPLVGRAGIGEVKTPKGWEVLVALMLVSEVAGVALWSPLGRRRLVTPARAAARSLAATLRMPVKALEVFGGSAGVTGGYILTLAASLRTFGALPILPGWLTFRALQQRNVI